MAVQKRSWKTLTLLNICVAFLTAPSRGSYAANISTEVAYPSYRYLGCFKDNYFRALPDYYPDAGGTIDGCFQKALKLGYKIFAVQNGGECWLDDSRANAYSKYGVSDACINGTGADWANSVYEIKFCASGYFLRNGSLGGCAPCPKDTYQEREGSVSCNPCPLGTSTFNSVAAANQSECSVKYRAIQNRSCSDVMLQYISTRIYCGDGDLRSFKANGNIAKELKYHLSGINYLLKAKINLKKYRINHLNSVYELEVASGENTTRYKFTVTSVKSYDIWFAKPFIIGSHSAIVIARLFWQGGVVPATAVAAEDAVLLYGISSVPKCPNSICLSMFVTWRRLAQISNQTVCHEDSEMLKLRYNACIAPPNITEGPKPQQVPLGTNTSLLCRVSSSIQFQRRWYKDGELIQNESGESLNIRGVPRDQGYYFCLVTSTESEITSQKALLSFSDLLSSLVYMVISNKKYSKALSNQNDPKVQQQSEDILKSISGYFKKEDFKWNVDFRIRQFKNDGGNVGAQVLVYSASKNVNVPEYYNEMRKLIIKGATGNMFESLVVSPLNSIHVLSLVYCLPETTGEETLQGEFKWNTTMIGDVSVLHCPHGPKGAQATRLCGGNFTVGGAWDEPDVDECSYKSVTTEKLHKLSKIKLGTNNVKEVATQVKDLTASSKPQDMSEADAALTAKILEEILTVPRALETTAQVVMETVDNVLGINETVLAKSQKNNRASTKFVKVIDAIAENLPLTDSQSSRLLTTSNIAIQSNKVDVTTFPGLSFAVTSTSSKNQPISQDNIFTGRPAIGDVQTSISLPRSLFANYQNLNSSGQQVSFVVYQSAKFFQPIDEGSRSRGWSMNSRVVAGSVRGMHIRNMTAPGVEMSFLPVDANEAGKPVCVYWDFNALGGLGNWSEEGCKFVEMSEGRVQCRCNHMTHFAVLFSVHGPEVKALEKHHLKALTIISYVGCAISLVGVTLTLLTYSLFRNLRKTSAQPILMSLCLSLMLLLILFMVGSGRTENKHACFAIAVMLHYFLLTTVMWMAVEGYQMYQAFIQVLATYTQKFMLKCSLVAWGIPAIVVISTAVGTMVAEVDGHGYGNDDYCVVTGIPLYAAVFAPVLLIIATNFIVYIYVLYSMGRSGALVSAGKSTTSYQRVRMAIAILVLLGLTWIFGALAIGSARLFFEYLFCIFNSLQGFFIFVFHCLRQKDVQRAWLACCRGKGFSHHPTTTDKAVKSRGFAYGSPITTRVAIVPPKRKITLSSNVPSTGSGAESPQTDRNSALMSVFLPPSPNTNRGGLVHV